MPRNKGGQVRRLVYPARLQDGTTIDDKIVNTFIGTFVTPITERVETLENLVDDLTAIARGVVQTALLTLDRGRRGGTTLYEPVEGFEEEAVGKPVLMTQASTDDRDEGGIVLFTAEVINVRQLRVRWFSAFKAPQTVQVVYLIG